jgi:hypothetical protein
MTRARNALVMAVLATAAGCGGREGAPPPEPSPSATARSLPLARPSAGVSLDTCQLLTRQEVEAALGKPVGEPVPEGGAHTASCRWTTPSGPEGATISVVVYDSPGEARDAFDLAIKDNGYKSVSGLGEGAYSSPMYEVTVLAGTYELAVDVSLLADEPAPAARKLARQAVARLPR